MVVKCRGHRLGPSHRSHLLHLVGRISYQSRPAKGVWPASITTRYTGGLGVWPATMPRPPHLQQSCPLLSRVVVGQDQPRPLLLRTLTQGQVKGQISSGVQSLFSGDSVHMNDTRCYYIGQKLPSANHSVCSILITIQFDYSSSL